MPFLHRFLLIIVLCGLVWSGIAPADRTTWWMEVAPVFIVFAILALTYNRFRLTNLLYILIAIHAWILMIGGHYTYAHVPLFDWIKEVSGTHRNSYDGIGHFAQGFVPAMAIREILLRTSEKIPKSTLFLVIILSCLGISAAYELIEWAAALALGQGADEFLGTQGDIWDTQKDMALAGIGAITALLTIASLHDKQLDAMPK